MCLTLTSTFWKKAHLDIICADLQLRTSHSVAFQGIPLPCAGLSHTSPQPTGAHSITPPFRPRDCRVSGGLCPQGRDMIFRAHSSNNYCCFCAEIGVDEEHPENGPCQLLRFNFCAAHLLCKKRWFFPMQLAGLSLSGAAFQLNPGPPVILTGLRKEPVFKLTKCWLSDT